MRFRKLALWGGSIGAAVTAATMPLMASAFSGFDTNIGSIFPGGGTGDLQHTVINAIQWVLTMLLIVAVVMIVYGGIMWLISAGNEKRLESAKKVISSAIIGLIIVLLAWTIVLFVGRAVTTNILNG